MGQGDGGKIALSARHPGGRTRLRSADGGRDALNGSLPVPNRGFRQAVRIGLRDKISWGGLAGSDRWQRRSD